MKNRRHRVEAYPPRARTRCRFLTATGLGLRPKPHPRHADPRLRLGLACRVRGGAPDTRILACGSASRAAFAVGPRCRSLSSTSLGLRPKPHPRQADPRLRLGLACRVRGGAQTRGSSPAARPRVPRSGVFLQPIRRDAAEWGDAECGPRDAALPAQVGPLCRFLTPRTVARIASVPLF
jgi:hypothetical protein